MRDSPCRFLAGRKIRPSMNPAELASGSFTDPSTAPLPRLFWSWRAIIGSNSRYHWGWSESIVSSSQLEQPLLASLYFSFCKLLFFRCFVCVSVDDDISRRIYSCLMIFLFSMLGLSAARNRLIGSRPCSSANGTMCRRFSLTGRHEGRTLWSRTIRVRINSIGLCYSAAFQIFSRLFIWVCCQNGRVNMIFTSTHTKT